MSHNMMTGREFYLRYPKEIFKELSLEKWKRLDLRYLIASIAPHRFPYIDACTCGHCEAHNDKCAVCKLSIGLGKGCSNRAHPWTKFKDALHTGNLAEACDYQFQMIKLIEDDILKNQ